MNKVAFLQKIKLYHADISVSAALCFMLTISAPVVQYANNVREFQYDVYDLFRMIILPSLILFFAVVTVLIIFHRFYPKIHAVLLRIYIIALIGFYLQGNVLKNEIPPLDGSLIDWTAYDYQRIPSVAVWCFAVIIVIGLSLILKEKFNKFAKYTGIISIAFVFLSTTILCFSSYAFEEKADCVVTDSHINEYSNDENFIILLLDAVDSGTFSEILDSNLKYYDSFKDFTYYKNTVGAYTYTTHNIPVILSGDWFENEQYTFQFLNSSYANSYFLKALEQDGYKLGIYEEELPLTLDSLKRFENVEKNLSNRFALPHDFYVLQIKLVGLKYLPYDLKKYCTFTTYYANNASKKIISGDNIFSPSNYSFYNSLSENSLTTVNNKCFRFIHIEGAHVPFQYNKNVEYIENATYQDGVECSITIANKYLDKLKDSGVYDNSIIIIMADHGYNGEWTYGRQNPILLVKGIDEHHELIVNQVPISFDDLQDAYMKLLDGNCSSNIFNWSESDERQRRYMFYYYNEEDTITEYVQTGYADNLDTMIETGTVYTHSRR